MHCHDDLPTSIACGAHGPPCGSRGDVPMSALPWILVGGGAVALGAYLWTRDDHPDDDSLPGRWVWPLGVWRGRKPEISDGFASNRRSLKGEAIRHAGVDLMYRR